MGQGTGLGLSMIYGFVRQSGGQARIYSEVGQGTMVCIYLQRHLGVVDPSLRILNVKAAPRARQGEPVLVVDDEPTVRVLVAEVLEELDYAAMEASDGPTGLRLLQSDVRIDLLVTDVRHVLSHAICPTASATCPDASPPQAGFTHFAATSQIASETSAKQPRMTKVVRYPGSVRNFVFDRAVEHC